jgi:hypothetical protein
MWPNTVSCEGKSPSYPCFMCSTINMLTMIFHWIDFFDNTIFLHWIFTDSITFLDHEYFWQHNSFAQIIYGSRILWTMIIFYSTNGTSSSHIHKVVRLVLSKKLYCHNLCKKLYCQKLSCSRKIVLSKNIKCKKMVLLKNMCNKI